MAQQPKPPEENDIDDFSLEPSNLDELTHNELLMLYEESAESIRFSKLQQWRTLGASLSTLLGVVLVAHLAGRRAEAYIQASIILCSMVASSSVYIMIAYQLRQNADRKKLKEISAQFSNLFRKIRALTPGWEEIFYRTTLLLFMITAEITVTAICTYYLMLRFY